MEENEDHGQSLTLLLLLFVSFVLLVVDSIELYQLITNWEYAVTIVNPIYDTCIKWELYTKTTFSTFSLFGAISSFSLTIFLLIDTIWFADKMLSTFLYFNYIVFGPYMLGFCILGLSNWNNVVYVCDKQNLNNKILSPANVFSLIGCFILSVMVFGLVAVYKTTTLYIDSILRRPDGNSLLRKTFWWFVFRNREPVEFIRRAQEQMNANEVRENNNNNV